MRIIIERKTHDIFGPAHLLLSFTYAYAPCIPEFLSPHTSGGAEGRDKAAARMTNAMTTVADREIPH